MKAMGTITDPQVRFGRRAGLPREAVGETDPWTDSQIPNGTLLPSGVDLHQVTILPNDEWKRIQNSLDKLSRKAAQLRAEKKAKKDMHLNSQEMVKHWANTYSGMRKQKLRDKELREQEEENEKQRIDMEEELRKAEERKKAIERAKIQEYYQTDRVKTFHRALLLSKVLKERDAQIRFQKKKLNTDAKWEEELKQNIEKALKKEKEKTDKRQNDRMAFANDLLKQIKEREEAEEQRKKQEEKDAKEIEKQAKLHELELIKRQEKKEEKMLECKKMHLETMENRSIIRAIEEQEREEEDEKIRKFIKAKKGLANIRREKDAETHRLMEERKERIFNYLSELIRKKLGNEDDILARDIAEAEAEREQEEKEKEEKRKAKLKEIEEYRIAVAEKKVNMKQQLENDLDYQKESEALVFEKEKEFKQYAREVIESESKSTKNIYPLLNAVKYGPGSGRGPPLTERGGIRPSYQAKDFLGNQLPDYTSRRSVEHDSIGKTKRRLGFTW
ncbi:coiled-coil domain-containing protein 173 isoform X2 [Sarcophilus harrisii]|uniref:coiled-coil domain-containing protein 173 isoform X2 n=1 Tax=Sarcophilus harrisii TaxID=9305 RepID=UPI00062B5445|nr:coiled-coil domain-containing protein 173 isoform X2 [Sarcophilus harrisii]